MRRLLRNAARADFWIFFTLALILVFAVLSLIRFLPLWVTLTAAMAVLVWASLEAE